MKHRDKSQTRRSFIQAAGAGFAGLAVGTSVVDLARPLFGSIAINQLPALGGADRNGVRLPEGFTSRIVARSGEEVRGYRWHRAPDGGATFATADDGWIYVSNSETSPLSGGGVSALRFDAAGEVQDAYRILGDTDRNCAGGPTPWGTWLSCEEVDRGRVYECDPTGATLARVRPALGYFKHEAVAVDPVTGHLYLTEDERDGRLYRYVPRSSNADGTPSLQDGTLQAARLDDFTGAVQWFDVPNPQPGPRDDPTRRQLTGQTTAFDGGEGIWYHNRKVYFTTKGDNRVWCLFLDTQILTIIYDARSSNNPILTGVDNVTVATSGNVLVAEDGGDMQIVVIDGNGKLAPLLQVEGQRSSEITGPAFSPDGSRLYFSSQRGGRRRAGITYEMSGPFQRLFG